MHLSIYSRAMILIGASLALITVIATVFIIHQDRVASARELRKRLDKLTEQQAISISRSLWNLNRDSTQLVLQGVARDPDFLSATVLDERGKVFVHFGNGYFGSSSTERRDAPIIIEENGKKQRIGTLSLIFSLERLQAAQRDAAWRALLLGILQLVAVLAATALALRAVTKPLEVITNRMLKVAQGVVDQNIPHMERRDQIGDISQAVETFRIETLERRKAEEALRLAHVDLERRVAERTQQLRVSEERLHAVIDNVPSGIFTIDKSAAILSANLATMRIFGYSAEELIGQNISILMPEPDCTGGHGCIANYGQSTILDGGLREAVGQHKTGSQIPLELGISEMCLGDGRTFVVVAHDITQRKESERRLLQSQKMEAVGQLTGGIAHDFNNLLTVILGNAEILIESLIGQPRMKRLAEMIGTAAQHGADLTRSLLAFSRKQMLHPRATNVNRLVSRMDGLLRRTLGEHIEIKLVTCDNVWATTVDPAQLEAAILNLAVNARDAMPRGGNLTIETSNVELNQNYVSNNEGVSPGSYVMMAVADTGTGMPPEIMARVFEPFFTTKEIGKGTGLGLSMVYGFAKHSNGHVKINSQVGQGTNVMLYLPRSRDAGQPRIDVRERPKVRGGGETILIVEDDKAVHAYAKSQINSLGYRALSAYNGAEALEMLRQDQPIDRLICCSRMSSCPAK
jgi:PAS domain S-box-containing protein